LAWATARPVAHPINVLAEIIKQGARRRPTSPAAIHSSTEYLSMQSRRWTPAVKAGIVEAVLNGTITLEQALKRYELSEEEFLIWHNIYAKHGKRGLRATKIQIYRGH
jgi:hypothetical protein